MSAHDCVQCGETCDCGGYDGCDLCSECCDVFDTDCDYGDENDYEFDDEDEL